MRGVRFISEVLTILALVGTGSSRASEESFSVGLWGVRETKDLPMVKAAGFNIVIGGESPVFLDAAATNALMVLARAPGKEEFGRLEHHPAVFGWLIEDEPEMRGMLPSAVAAEQDLLKSYGSKKPTALTLFHGDAAADYANIADITICDRYPVPWQPLCSFGQHLRMVRLAIGPAKPLMATIQAFDWDYFPESRVGGPGKLRPPTYAELRCMTYCALVQHVRGILYYAYDEGRWRMAEHPNTWEALCRVVRDLNERLPLFTAEPQWWPKAHHWAAGQSGFNESLESSIDSTLVRVRHGSKAVPEGNYLVAVNNTGKIQDYSVTVPTTSAKETSALDEARDVVVKDGWLTDRFEAYSVHVYGPLK